MKKPLIHPFSFLIRLNLSLLTLGLVLAAPGCSGSGSKPTGVEPASTYFPIPLAGQTVDVQLALSSEEIQRGLMFRESMPADAGMLFVFDNAQQRSFYMRNTKIPLDIGYFTRDGVLREIYPMYPLDETPVRSRRMDIQLVLEMNQGWFRDNAIKPGDRIDLQAVTGALQARGFPPDRFRLALAENQ